MEPSEEQAEPESLDAQVTDTFPAEGETGGSSEPVDASADDDEAIEDEANESEEQTEPGLAINLSEEEDQEDEQPEGKRVKIFISYNRNPNDSLIAERIYEELSRFHDVFLDSRSIGPAQDYQAVTETWLATCDFVIALISAQSVRTDYIKAELERAYLRYKTEARPIVIPLRINYAGPSGLRLEAYMGRFQAIFWDNQNYLWLFEQLYAGLTGKLPPIAKASIAGTDMVAYTEGVRARYVNTFEPPRELIARPVTFENEKLLWITGDASVRNYVALSLGAIGAKSVYEIAKQRTWTEINNTAVSDSALILRDALPAPWLESGAIAEWQSLRAIIERNNIIVATSPEDEFNKLQQELLRHQFTDFQHRHVDSNSYTSEAKRKIFSRMIEYRHEKGELEDDKFDWAADLLKEPNETIVASDGRARATERRRRDMRRKFSENIARWLPSDIEWFVLSLSQVRTESDVARLLQRSAAVEEEVRAWFLGLDDSTRYFVLALALFPNVENEELWARYKSINEQLRRFDPTLPLLPFGICRQRAHPYVSIDGPIEFHERVAETIRQEIARSYREYFLELIPQLKGWSVPPGRNPKTDQERRQRKPKIEETRTARNSIAKMVGTVARLGLEDLTDILEYWATDSNIQIRKSVALAFKETAKSPTAVSQVLGLLEKWALDLNSNGQHRWRALTAAQALGYVTAAANHSYVTLRSLQCLRMFARSRRPDARFYASMAIREISRYAPLTSTEGALARLANDDRTKVRLNVAAALNEARVRDPEAANALFDRWIEWEEPNRRWVAICGIVIDRDQNNGNGRSKIERLMELLNDEEAAHTLASVFGETAADDYCGQAAKETFSQLVSEVKENAWRNFAAGLGAIPVVRLERELFPLLHFNNAPPFEERAIEVRREVLSQRFDDPTRLLSILKSWLSGNEQVRLETFRALTMLLDKSVESTRSGFITTLAAHFARNPAAVTEMLANLNDLAPAEFVSVTRAVWRESFRYLLAEPGKFLALTQKYLADHHAGPALREALEALAANDPVGAREELLRALLLAHDESPETTRDLLLTLRSIGTTEMISLGREFDYLLVEAALLQPNVFPARVLEMVRQDNETFSLINSLATPGALGRRDALVRALVQAKLNGVTAVEELLARPEMREWQNLTTLPSEVGRSFYVRNITRKVKEMFVRRTTVSTVPS